MEWLRSTRIEKSRPTVHVRKHFDRIRMGYDRLNIMAESGLRLGCANIGGKSSYAISCVSPTTDCPTPRPTVTNALYLRDRRINIHIAAL
jgi:hypothetical protein